MSAITRGRLRDQLTFVLINDLFLYGWKTVDLAAATGISEADLTTQLGHKDAAAAAAVPNRIMVVGANAPKPRRATKRFANAPTTALASISTFIAYDKAVAAAAGGWSVAGAQRGVRLRAAAAGRRSVSAVAELSNGVLYVFPMNAADFELTKEPLGLQSAAQITAIEAKKLASGMASTKPGRAALEDSGGMLTSFYSTANKDEASAAGFDIISDERVLFPGAVVVP